MNANSINRPDDQAASAVIMDIRHISAAQLAQLGMQQAENLLVALTFGRPIAARMSLLRFAEQDLIRR